MGSQGMVEGAWHAVDRTLARMALPQVPLPGAAAAVAAAAAAAAARGSPARRAPARSGSGGGRSQRSGSQGAAPPRPRGRAPARRAGSGRAAARGVSYAESSDGDSDASGERGGGRQREPLAALDEVDEMDDEIERVMAHRWGRARRGARAGACHGHG